jgi:CubicO group peptidase (beta-lactamase class C family)
MSAAAPIAGSIAAPRPFRRDASTIAPAALAEAQVISDCFDGVCLLVWHDGVLVHEHYAQGHDASAPLQAYSMAKTVLALVFGIAAARGLVAPDDKVSLHLEEWRDDPRGEITLLQLLQMRSGLKLYSLDRREPEALRLAFGTGITETALATPLAAPPGAGFEYANVNAFLAGLALERALRRAGLGSFIAFLERELWQPLGLMPASWDLDGPGGVPRFFAGLNATARDWLSLGLLFVDAGSAGGRPIVSQDWIATMIAPSPNPAYGLGLWRGTPWQAVREYGPGTPVAPRCDEPYRAADLVFFDGIGGQRVYVSPQSRLVIVRAGALSRAWEDSAVPNAILRGLP